MNQLKLLFLVGMEVNSILDIYQLLILEEFLKSIHVLFHIPRMRNEISIVVPPPTTTIIVYKKQEN